ncbi:NAD-dependent dehydrogenase subunit [Rhodoferax ferrireducens T118]|uniref:NAD-dependent dehydrogenase subunit n=1 Tax=Albidiferax ferrireducens (strain ATCC BAA-621 / DSM 15236 / T118) TaxID=338969 RepID=Q21TB7_ALBFT|nr:NADH-quinone oxidoreductase subunit H [Rhodoferax ferrireducens]ABD70986.1 NAD-dependent dehydrogenase subunit [Rhodoferax ferrireducens T118]
MNTLLTVTHGLLVLSLPIVLVGLVNRTKSWWAGRKGPRLLQSASDLRRLLGKRPIISTVASPLFRSSAYVVLICGLAAASMVPMLGQFAPVQFSHDFVVVAYTLGLARIALMISAMDVGSAFEGMGAAREASFSTYAEPALFLLIGAAGAATGMTSFADLIGQLHKTPYFPVIVFPLVVALLILLQTEAARVPVDDPLTHLELTMIHEVMILDHSGPELAAMQYAAALKMTLYAGLIAALINPMDPLASPMAAIGVSLGLMLLVALLVGCIESLTARLPMRWVTRYVLIGSGAAIVSMVVVGLGASGL